VGVVEQVQPGLGDSREQRQTFDRRMDDRGRRERELARADHPEHDAVGVVGEPSGGEERTEEEDRREPVAVERPAERCEEGGEADEQQPRLREVACGEHL